MVRDPVSGEEVLQTQDTGGLRCADQHRTARAGFDQPHAAQDQCADDPFAKVRLGDDQRAQLLGRHQQRLDVFLRMSIHERGAARQGCDLGEKLTAAVSDERHHVTQAVALTECHVPCQQDEHAGPGLTRRDEALAIGILSWCAETADARDLGVRQLRKYLVASGHDSDWGIVGH